MNTSKLFLYFIEFFPDEKRIYWVSRLRNLNCDQITELHIEILIQCWIIFNEEYGDFSESVNAPNKPETEIQHENKWAVNLLDEMISCGDDELSWFVLNQLWVKINKANDRVRVMFGVGPMEDFMRHFSEKYIDNVIIWARSDEHFKRTLLEDVWGKKDWSENAKAKMKVYFDECMSEDSMQPTQSQGNTS